MKKIIHIHTDAKFVEISLKRYNCSEFENHLLFLGDRKPDDLNFHKSVQFGYNSQSIKKVVSYCIKADLVIVYDLDVIKSGIVNQLPKNIKIAWRFFGYELYGKNKEAYLSSLTRELVRKEKEGFINWFKSILGPLKPVFYHLKWGFYPESEFYKAITRINYFFCLYKKEYEHLCRSWKNLPEFVQIPLRENKKFGNRYLGKKQSIVIIGNSRNAVNNHADSLRIIKNVSTHKDINFLMLFNYGSNNGYANAIRSQAKGINNLATVDEFLSYDEFKNLYSRVSALVINGYRQMAVGNIFQALTSGVKVYLNEKNTLYAYLSDNNIKVFNINDFKADIQNGNIFLKHEDQKHNNNMLQELYSKYTIADFQKEILHLI